MSRPYFSEINGAFEPAEHARGPWAEDMLHGRLLGGLAARALDAAIGDDRLRITRLTVDLFRPAGMAPVQVDVRPVRMGRKVRVADAVLTCGGHEVGRVTAVALATGEEPPGRIWRPEVGPFPAPEDAAVPTDATGAAENSGWLFRTVTGGMGSGELSRIWTNDTNELVAGEAMSPIVRAAISGDIACPLANSGDQGLYYINADYTMLLARHPVGDWIGIEVAQQLQADGISVAAATLVDEQGAFATSAGSSLARPPLDQSP